MPIEIKELIIKMNIEENQFAKSKMNEEISAALKNKIVKECVEKVLKELESKVER